MEAGGAQALGDSGQAAVPAGTDGAVINNFAYLYDQCASALALSYAGKHERARHARWTYGGA